jgi:hypothetical protein
MDTVYAAIIYPEIFLSLLAGTGYNSKGTQEAESIVIKASHWMTTLLVCRQTADVL